MKGRELTGRDVFLITAGAFSIIIAVNVTLAVSAVRTFPGLEVKNSYVASQSFDRDRTAQLALGWEAEARVTEGRLVLSLTDATGAPAHPETLTGTFGRATHVADDVTPDFTFDGTAWSAPVAARPGNWNLRLEATAPDGTIFRQRVIVHVPRQG
ncbi:FixH family protein [Ovoidimarina sediminis]|uniref:FixH family protein n=1 Tax=Ovoidimarina sediminis TaxID=3079856 RepID=UPI00290A967E|nr:FixH family protein [Rhodophyticola sp. MJ-SS7]MDU8945926.1 FixH family protein [Rhodophyticola sp. MJ-SS7]